MSEFLYVPQYDNTVSVINAATDTVVGTIPLDGQFPDTVAVSPDGAFVYVASESGLVSVINATTNTVTATINVGGSPRVIALSPNGTIAYVNDVTSGTIAVIDTTTNSLVTKISIGAAAVYGIVFSPDGTRAYLSNGTVIDTATNSVVSTIANVDGINVAVSPDGTHLYIASGAGLRVIDTTTNSVAALITGVSGWSVVVSPDGSLAYATNDHYISVIDTATNEVLSTIDTGSFAGGVAISHDGSLLYVTHYGGSSTVSVINTATDQVVDTINVGVTPVYPAVLDIAPVPVITSEVVSKSGVVTLTGTTGEANDTVTVYDGATLLGTATTDSNGAWSFTTKAASKVSHSYTATATDFVGNIGHGNNEAILGTSKADSLIGGSGNDIIIGNGGNDTLRGGSGADLQTGGSGNVAFSYSAITDSTPASYDTITDFRHNHDKIDFTNIAGINASHGVPTFQGKLTQSGNLTLNPHSVAYIEVGGNTEVLVNTTNNPEIVTTSDVSAANMKIVLVGIHLGLTSTDFHHF
jgi:YVTN family beta-propeller protein